MSSLRKGLQLFALLVTITGLSVFVFSFYVSHPPEANALPLDFQAVDPPSTEAPFISNAAPPSTDDISFVLNSNACALSSASDSITAVLMVPSHAGKLAQRALVRSTFPSPRLAGVKLRRVFVLASLADDTEPDKRFPSATAAQLLNESRLYDDIVQTSFVEAYAKLVHKNIMAFRWAKEFCPHARFVAKMDDDNLVNYYKVSELLQSIPVADENDLMGMQWTTNAPYRYHLDRYFVSYEEYAPKMFPSYMSGLFYWTSMASIRKLLDAVKKVPFFKMEDVFITGLASKVAGLKQKDFGDWMTNLNGLVCCKNATSRVAYQCTYMMGLNEKKDKTIFQRTSERIEFCRMHVLNCMPPPTSRTGLECF